MTDTIPHFAPGCFGSALTFDEAHPVCRGCTFQEQCKPLHAANLFALRARWGITTEPDAPKGKEKAAPTNPGELALPKKTQELVDRLDRSNLNVTEKLQKGENPFAGTLPFMRIVAHLLIKLDRPLTRQLVAAAFMTKFEWQQNTADAHARMAFQALEHIGAVREMNGTIQIKRT